MAIRMALDMGLAKDLHKNIEEIEASHTGDSVSTTTSISPSTRLSVHLNKASVNANSTGVKNSRSNNSPHRKKLAVMLQERRLAWLACFFLDGLSNSLLGFDYSVTHVHLEMRKLIREANWTIDTTQGATLIFWYLHLDLIQLYRRICEMYRSTVLATTKQGEGLAMMTVLRGTEKLSIEHALKTWISALPAHLVYTAQSSQSSTTASNDQSSKSDASVPSYYTLYLHRFYFSIRLLLYRPLIASKSHRGLLSDPSSAISQCTSAAALLTEIGELIFQNYSWPWPGCGLFAYHMVQAAEIHIYLMVSRAQPGAHDLFNRTMDLIESYATLVKLPSLEKDVVAVRQAVDNYVKANDPMPSLSRPTPSSILLQIQQYQQQQQAQDQKRHQTEEYAANTRATVATPEYPYLNAIPACMSPTTPIIAQLAQQHLHINPSHHHPQPVIQSELAGGASGETKGDTHLFLPPTSSCTLFSPIPTTGAETIVPTDLFHIPPSESSNSFSVNSLGPNATSQVLRQQHSPLSSFLNDIEARALYTQADHDIFDPMQPSQQQQGYESSYSYLQPPVMSTPHHPIDDLINLGGTQRDQTAQLSSSNEAGPHSLRRPLATAMATGAATAASDVQSNNLVHQTSQSLLPLSPIPPLKPPKRIFPQSTGSTNSSNRSLSQRPPVPKKPTRFTTDADDSHAQSSSWSSLLRLPYQLQQPTYSHSHQYHDSDPLPPALSSPAVTAQMNRRPIKVLQAQSQLYGQGGFKSSVAQNQRGARGSNGRDDYQQEEAHFEWTHSDTNEYSAVEYMKFNQHLRNPDLLPNRPRIL
ncbi:hypothetical protein EDD11_009713 [Mortierella claussenii]|nr:hypothetical protein EDD11_009713 [Mortierella claussenii]